MEKTFLIIDSHALIHRAYHALPPLVSPDGTMVNGVYGFLLVLFKLLEEIKPDYIAAAFDLPKAMTMMCLLSKMESIPSVMAC